MTDPIVNKTRLAGNTCFGCGHDNHRGLRIELHEDGDRIVGAFVPGEHNSGFPGIAHGGALFTALDCLTTWTASLLRSERRALWLLRSSNVTYHRPARIGDPVSLSGAIAEQGEAWRAVVVHAEARDASGELICEGRFRAIPVPEDKFKAITGLAEIPANWRDFLENTVGR